MNYKNDLILKALRGEEVPRPPVWMMRQAGRYLPDFMKLKAKYSFFERAETPELATEITLMPIDQIGVDAAIIFSDILVIPQALGFHVEMKPDVGPWFEQPVVDPAQVEAIQIPDVADRLHYVMDAIKMTVAELDGRVPLIGFAGAPWTILCYMVEGRGSKDFAKAKAFCFKHPEAAAQLLDKITTTTIAYLNAQHKAGAEIIQLFDSWGGLLSQEDYMKWSFPYIKRIVEETDQDVLKIVFAKGTWYALEDFSHLPINGLGVDWTITPEFAKAKTGGRVTLQGNLDPSFLLAPIHEIQERTTRMIEGFGKHRYIANLGHGILPNVPVPHAQAFVDTVKQASHVEL